MKVQKYVIFFAKSSDQFIVKRHFRQWVIESRNFVLLIGFSSDWGLLKRGRYTYPLK